jgi:hypothetical protein
MKTRETDTSQNETVNPIILECALHECLQIFIIQLRFFGRKLGKYGSPKKSLKWRLGGTMHIFEVLCMLYPTWP